MKECLETDQMKFLGVSLFLRSGPVDTFPAKNPW